MTCDFFGSFFEGNILLVDVKGDKPLEDFVPDLFRTSIFFEIEIVFMMLSFVYAGDRSRAGFYAAEQRRPTLTLFYMRGVPYRPISSQKLVQNQKIGCDFSFLFAGMV